MTLEESIGEPNEKKTRLPGIVNMFLPAELQVQRDPSLAYSSAKQAAYQVGGAITDFACMYGGLSLLDTPSAVTIGAAASFTLFPRLISRFVDKRHIIGPYLVEVLYPGSELVGLSREEAMNKH